MLSQRLNTPNPKLDAELGGNRLSFVETVIGGARQALRLHRPGAVDILKAAEVRGASVESLAYALADLVSRIKKSTVNFPQELKALERRANDHVKTASDTLHAELKTGDRRRFTDVMRSLADWPLTNGRSIEYSMADRLVSDVMRIDLKMCAAAIQGRKFSLEMHCAKPSPVRAAIAVIDALSPKPEDIIIDGGCGAGVHAMTLSCLCPARIIGVEYHEGLVQLAERTRQTLNLQNVEIVHADLTDFEFSRGNIFYFYSPFGGEILQAVSKSLRHESERRQIVVANLWGGPDTPADSFELIYENCAGWPLRIYRSK